ncbi:MULTISPECIES: sugar ABC transporter ATP-binding protein [Rhizobium/Agrobacterium group]|uniref:sugar ABC transporter ATP-binding protein n=1 Tax=Rhizobium/Agrobacterium group TaxID=227290 RepID=UPI0003F1F8AA|nr:MULTISPECIES: sugar ABC transporter ATP-binding protein [Rhizobium/Agrobacterium group]AHK03671.1 ribose ABC transport system, ATP-bindingprotein RbsA [Agrobacterium tumefaciens LBA4213 (Ach5)]AKC09433.1 ribose transport system ATP-binding protein [Agrobacterium tumefaciens]AYM18576.1 ribose transport system ATP-binding protein [Agrobacterium tumefaciens]AYM69875.1 ribose transport system ATP-binding protein [Agrobacterium tumefaciens]NIB56371.1 sugar ABC transporter ATP-binding protein [Ag
MGEVILNMTNIHKAFGPVRALRTAAFELRRGEIHALAGENGAGKSTLMHIIDGILQPDGGEILLDGKPVKISSPNAANRLGIGFVHQEIALCPEISVAENMFMSETGQSKSWFMNYRDLGKRAATILKEIGDIDPTSRAGDLSISQQQIVEIAKALTLDCRILILDEPTAALTETEAQTLFRIMHRLAERGIAIIYISHRMAEIFEHCDRITVMRDGCHIRTENISEISPEEVVNSMVGRVLDKLYPPKLAEEEKSNDVILSVRGLNEGKRVFDVDFDLRRGEILGLAGLIGAGRSEIVRAVCRLEGKPKGEVTLRGRPLRLNDYRDSIREGLVYLSEDRKGNGLFLNMSIAANVSALDVGRISNGMGFIERRKEMKRADELGRRLKLRANSVGDAVSTLSGGNQQKVALAKMLSVGPQVVFLDEPTRGVDVGAKAEIHRQIRELAREGVGVIVISSELPELIGVSDRVLVVREGRIAGEVEGEDMTEEKIMQLASINIAESPAGA